jgi:hypothetical protein
MLRRKLLLIAFGLIIVSTAEAQNANILSMRELIESKYLVDLDTLDLCETIILNGIPFRETDIDGELKKFKAKDILLTGLGDLSREALAHMNCRYIIVLDTGDNQPEEDKNRILGIIRNNLNANFPKPKTPDYLCSQCKQVMVDGRSVDPYAAQAMLNKLKVKYIKYIASYKSADPRIYGQNAKNGLIEIYLTAKGKKRRVDQD